jgi:hypothetical protein
MALCVEHQFDVLLTIDKNLQFQQNLDKYPVTVVVLNSFTSKVEELITFLPSLRIQLGQLEKHRAYLINR